MVPEACPGWFQGFNLAFQLIFLYITTSIAYRAHKAHEFFGEQRYRCLSIGFAIFAFSYIANIVSTATHIFGGSRDVAVAFLYVYAILFLAAVIFLLFTYLEIDRPSVRAAFLIIVFGFVALIPGGNEMLFHLVTALLMFFIVGQLMIRYRKTCKKSTLAVTLGFAALTLGQLVMAVGGKEIFFVIAAVLTLIGFMSIAASRVVR